MVCAAHDVSMTSSGEKPLVLDPSPSTYAEEISELLLLLFVVWRIPGNVRRRALKEVGHENLVWTLLIAVRQNICALKCLWEKAEDVITAFISA